MALVNKGPNADNGKKVLDFVLSDASQTMWGNAYLRPVFADKLSAEAKAKFLPDADYARAKPVDLKKLAAAQKAIIERYKNEVKLIARRRQRRPRRGSAGRGPNAMLTMRRENLHASGPAAAGRRVLRGVLPAAAGAPVPGRRQRPGRLCHLRHHHHRSQPLRLAAGDAGAGGRHHRRDPDRQRHRRRVPAAQQVSAATPRWSPC